MDTDTYKVGNDPRGIGGVDANAGGRTAVDDYGFDWDPYYDPDFGGTLRCKSVFALHFNDGAPFIDFDTIDSVDYHSSIKGTELHDDISGDSEGDQNELDSVALALRQNDCRDDIDGHQEIISYFVYAALGADEQSNNSTRRMREAAARGGFVDDDNDNQPDPMWPVDAGGTSYTSFNTYAALDEEDCPISEWDGDGDCEPDTFYLATDGAEIREKLQDAITTYLARVSSGGAASVVRLQVPE